MANLTAVVTRQRRFVSFDLFSTLVDLDDVEDESAFERFAAEMRVDGIDASGEWWAERKAALTDAAFARASQPLAEGGDIDVFEVFLAMVIEATAGRSSDSHALARTAARRFRRCATRRLTAVPQVVAALPLLRDEFSLLVVSNTQRCYSEDEMSAVQLADVFDAIVFSSDVGRCKPHPELFERGLALVGATPEQWLHVGDNPDDDARGALGLGGSAIYLDRPDRPAREGAAFEAVAGEVEAVVTVDARSSSGGATAQLVTAVRRWSEL